MQTHLIVCVLLAVLAACASASVFSCRTVRLSNGKTVRRCSSATTVASKRTVAKVIKSANTSKKPTKPRAIPKKPKTNNKSGKKKILKKKSGQKKKKAQPKYNECAVEYHKLGKARAHRKKIAALLNKINTYKKKKKTGKRALAKLNKALELSKKYNAWAKAQLGACNQKAGCVDAKRCWTFGKKNVCRTLRLCGNDCATVSLCNKNKSKCHKFIACKSKKLEREKNAKNKPPKKKPCVCPMVYAPVCDSKGMPFSNACLARCAGVANPVPCPVAKPKPDTKPVLIQKPKPKPVVVKPKPKPKPVVKPKPKPILPAVSPVVKFIPPFVTLPKVKGCKIVRRNNMILKTCRKCVRITRVSTNSSRRLCRVKVRHCRVVHNKRNGKIQVCCKRQNKEQCNRFKRCKVVAGKKQECRSFYRCRKTKRCRRVRQCSVIRSKSTGQTRTQCVLKSLCKKKKTPKSKPTVGPKVKIIKKKLPCQRIKHCQVIRNKKTGTSRTACKTILRCKKAKPKCRVLKRCRVIVNKSTKKSRTACKAIKRCRVKKCRQGLFKNCKQVKSKKTNIIRTLCKIIRRRCVGPKKPRVRVLPAVPTRPQTKCKVIRTVGGKMKLECNAPVKPRVTKPKNKSGKKKKYCKEQRRCQLIRNKKTGKVRTQCTVRGRKCSSKKPKCTPVHRCRVLRHKKNGTFRKVCTLVNNCPPKKKSPRCSLVKVCRKLKNNKSGNTRTVCKQELKCKKCSKFRRCRVLRHKKTGKFKHLCRVKYTCQKPKKRKCQFVKKCQLRRGRKSGKLRTVCKRVKRCQVKNFKNGKPVKKQPKKKTGKKVKKCTVTKKNCRYKRSKKTGRYGKICKRVKKCKFVRLRSGAQNNCHIFTINGKKKLLCAKKQKKQPKKKKTPLALVENCDGNCAQGKCKAGCTKFRRCQVIRNKKTGARRTVCKKMKRCPLRPGFRRVRRCELVRNKKTGKVRSSCRFIHKKNTAPKSKCHIKKVCKIVNKSTVCKHKLSCK